mmetsp:Transcript_25102/g.40542  ORF Transcript_25102/g.40542 Transcript_25102/m.40542 type:complete len:430 (-) Transcript_25102:160-1449(-)
MITSATPFHTPKRRRSTLWHAKSIALVGLATAILLISGACSVNLPTILSSRTAARSASYVSPCRVSTVSGRRHHPERRSRTSSLVVGSTLAVAPDNVHDTEIRKSPLGSAEGTRKSFETMVGGRRVLISYDTYESVATKRGEAVPTLFLATPSFVPSRATFADLAASMTINAPEGSPEILPILTELPGYGLNDAALLDLDAYEPEFFREFLAKFFSHLNSEYNGAAINIVSAGHAGFYVLDAAKQHPEMIRNVFLLNPTYRGPLTTVKMKNKENAVVPLLIDGLCGGIAAAYKLPDPVGSAVHASQCSEGSIKKAMLSHVFEDPSNVTPEAVEVNRQFAAEGERWGKCAFLVGRTDPYPRREDAASAYESGVPVRLAVCVGAKEQEAFERDLDFLTERGVPLIATPGAQRNFVEYPDLVAKEALAFFSS